MAADDWQFSPSEQKAYDLVLSLKLAEARQLIGTADDPADHYILSLAEALEVLITEDEKLTAQYEKSFEERQNAIVRNRPHDQFVQAEMRLHWTFIYLRAGREFDAALSLRNAWQIADACRKKYGDFTPIRKTTGLLEIMLGSVPEKYNWLLSLLGMQGSVTRGIDDLGIARRSQSSVAREADLLLAIVRGFIFQEPDLGLADVTRMMESEPENELLKFLAATLSIKSSQSGKALAFLAERQDPATLPLWQREYMKGEAFLHKAEYGKAIEAYSTFIANHGGKDHRKDAFYKTGMAYWLSGDEDEALSYFEQARNNGTEKTEADKHAARSLSDPGMPNVMLYKVRYFTDGGYNTEAHAVLDSISPSDIPSRHDQVEYYYRKARLAHKENQAGAARIFYRQCIDMSPAEEEWYFAPNACLQMAYIELEERNSSEAKAWFRRALQYKRHPYKNSIDSKAKTGLAQLRRK